MISCSSESEDDEINLTDSDFEKASNIFRLLDVVYGKPIPFFQPNHQLYFGLRKGQALKELITGLVPVIQLAEKYDCAAAVQHLRLAFRALSNVADSWYSFRSAVQINELECATEAIRRGAMLPLLPPSHKDDIHLEKIVLPDTPKPAGFSLRQCRRMPVDILWALDRACRKDNWMETEGPPANGIEHSREECWNNVASRFAKLMKRINSMSLSEPKTVSDKF